MLLKHCRWHPELTADLNLDSDDIETMAKELVTFHQCFHRAYGRIEHHRLGLAYLSGLMSNERPNPWATHQKRDRFEISTG